MLLFPLLLELRGFTNNSLKLDRPIKKLNPEFHFVDLPPNNFVLIGPSIDFSVLDKSEIQEK